MDKKRIAVFFGGRSFEHDVSIITGLEVLNTIDSTRYDAFPVYVDLEGTWWTGEALLNRKNYHLTKQTKEKLTRVILPVGEQKPILRPVQKGLGACLFGGKKDIAFDFAFLAFHGDYGEDGCFQGLMETAQVPYSGCRVMASSVFMNKAVAKKALKAAGVPVLEDVLICRPAGETFPDIAEMTKDIRLPFPLLVKPNALGSSVGIHKVTTQEELQAAVLQIFALNADALLEPFVENLEEYNISVTNAFGQTRSSVIERPLKDKSPVLGFAEKYLAGGGTKGTKSAQADSQGMLSLTRVFNPPELTDKEASNIRSWAETAFNALFTTGVVRIDFLCNAKTREFYLGEVNTIPGSFAFYLWEASEPKESYPALLSALIEEGIKEYEKRNAFPIHLTESKIFNRNKPE